MATTSLWSIRGWIGKVINYATNPEKTGNPDYLADVEGGSLEGALDYTTNPAKTEQQLFVSGINCTPENARETMNRTKKQYGKQGGIVAFHAYQSFKPGETAPEAAHAIGIRLATELWGSRFEMVVSTHLDKSHIHNHVIINSVSFADGKRFHSDSKCYHDMRRASDRLCREHGLSVIENPKHGKSKHYGEWKADQEDRPTWRSIIKADVDEAIAKAMTDRQFYQNLERIGYEIKTGKDISVRPPGKERYLRLARNFGDGYTYESIARRILANRQPRLPIPKPGKGSQQPKKLPPLLKGNLIGLYRHYRYLFGHYSRGNPGNGRMHFLLREDIRAFDAITDELKLLEREGIETAGQLLSFEEKLSAQIDALTDERKALHAEAKAAQSSGTTDKPPRIAEINEQLKTLRREVRQCRRIEERSTTIQNKIMQMEDEQGKEAAEHGCIGTGGRTARKDNARR